jgi:hypothetical protein
MAIPQHQVLITPLVRPGVYGSTVDVTQDIDISDLVLLDGIGVVRQEIDQGDYDVGVYKYGAVSIATNNQNGKFNDHDDDIRSIFPLTRDKAKVTINYLDISSGTNITFKGLVNDQATRQDVKENKVFFTVISIDSILETVVLSSGTIKTGDSYSVAIKTILQLPEISSILTYDAANISVLTDLVIDDETKFDNVVAKTALNNLLIAAGSVLYVNDNGGSVVSPRTANSNTPHQFYYNDLQGRDNVNNITGYNKGFQRMFNNVKINTTARESTPSIKTYGTKQKSFTLSFVTDSTKEATIADQLLDDFKFPLIEFNLVAKTEDTKSIVVLDKLQLDAKPLQVPADEKFLPVVGQAQVGVAKVPLSVGSFFMDSRKVFKVISIIDQQKDFTTILKVRDTGELL